MALKLSFDVVNQSLVQHQGSATTLVFGQSLYPLEIRLVKPVADSIPGDAASYDTFDDSAYDGIRVGIWSDSTGTVDDSSTFMLAFTAHSGFTRNTDDPDDPYWSGNLDTKTTQMGSWLGSGTHDSAYFAVNLVSGLKLRRVFDHRSGATNCTINSATDDGSADLPTDAR